MSELERRVEQFERTRQAGREDGDLLTALLMSAACGLVGVVALMAVAAMAGCGGYTQTPPTPQRTAFEQRAIALAEVARWELATGDPLPRCRGELTLLRWETGTDEQVSALCTTNRSVSACFRYVGDTPVITLAERPRTDQQLLIVRLHELTHWALQCSGVDETGDPEHTRGDVWEGLL